ncbi:hypothetical protein FCV25MIE_14447, partial [Fagus crenata]
YNLRPEQVDPMQSLNSVAQRIVLLETPMTRLLVDNGDEIVVSGGRGYWNSLNAFKA